MSLYGKKFGWRIHQVNDVFDLSVHCRRLSLLQLAEIVVKIKTIDRCTGMDIVFYTITKSVRAL